MLWEDLVENNTKKDLKYDRPISIAEGVFWIGFYDTESGLHCNPYIIVEEDEAIVIDGGSRPDFPTVMMKILQAGIHPSSISALIYHHYDPDLCGSIPNFEEIIDKDDLQIISEKYDIAFIKHYAASSKLVGIDSMNLSFKFKSGRELKFIKTPYSHSAGSFVTFDSKTGILFTSDIFGSFSLQWDLYLDLTQECYTCSDYSDCPNKSLYCPLPDILNFHRRIMTSDKALKYAIDEIKKIPAKIIAPQHGSVVNKQNDIDHLFNVLGSLDKVGIDGII